MNFTFSLPTLCFPANLSQEDVSPEPLKFHHGFSERRENWPRSSWPLTWRLLKVWPHNSSPSDRSACKLHPTGNSGFVSFKLQRQGSLLLLCLGQQWPCVYGTSCRLGDNPQRIGINLESLDPTLPRAEDLPNHLSRPESSNLSPEL